MMSNKCTPPLNRKESKRFIRLIEEGLKNPVGPVPTPKLEKARLLIRELNLLR